jgi:hypothetical protein
MEKSAWVFSNRSFKKNKHTTMQENIEINFHSRAFRWKE